MKKINFYIGSNNTTHILESDKALKILSSYYEGMSITEIVGYWKGAKENTILVSIMAESVDYTQVKTVCKKLNKTLDQQAIMVEILDSNTLFISDR
jgi:hypothetical protein